MWTMLIQIESHVAPVTIVVSVTKNFFFNLFFIPSVFRNHKWYLILLRNFKKEIISFNYSDFEKSFTSK